MSFKLVIQDDEGKTTVVPLKRDEITIGRKEGNTIRLTERNVSRRHARILHNNHNGEVHIEDLGSYNGIRVNNARIAERVSLRVSDQVQIGDYKLYLKPEVETDDARTVPLERVEGQHPVEALGTLPPGSTAPMTAVPATPSPAVAPMIGAPNRTMVALSDTDPTVRGVGPATAAAVAALTAQGGYGKLVVLSSNFAGKEFELSRPQMIIGRTDENDIVINHRSISRNHAKLVREPETSRYTISDLQSSNGVRVNGQDYGKVELRRGDVVDLGHVRLRFVEAGEDFVFARDAVITDVPEAGTKRGMLVAILAAVVVVVAVVVLYTMRSSSEAHEVATPGSGTNGALVLDAGDTNVAANDHGSDGSDEPSQVVPSAVRPDDERGQKLKQCTEAQANQQWQALRDCAGGLEALDKDKAREFKEKAFKEQDAELNASKARQALSDKNLKLAESLLTKIGDGSVYYKNLYDPFSKAENQALDTAIKRANGYATAHDCAGLNKFKQQTAAKETTRTIAAVSAVKCVEKTTPTEVAAVKPPVVPTQPDPVATPAVTPKPAASGCETMVVDDLLQQAENQYRAGYPKPALALLLKVLACKQDVRMYRLAVTYACEGKDPVNAKLYFAKVPAQFQPNLEQKCQQMNIAVRSP
jgi:pSer/pThr/pTyr-binding forkhead associated (FHA) protein